MSVWFSYFVLLSALFSSNCFAAIDAEKDRAIFGMPASPAQIAFADQPFGPEDLQDINEIIDECQKIQLHGPIDFRALKIDGWLLEKHESDDDGKYNHRLTFVHDGMRGKLISHIYEGDLDHCEAQGRLPYSGEFKNLFWKQIISFYHAVPAAEYNGENWFIKKIRNNADISVSVRKNLLQNLYISPNGIVFGQSDAAKLETISVKIY